MEERVSRYRVLVTSAVVVSFTVSAVPSSSQVSSASGQSLLDR